MGLSNIKLMQDTISTIIDIIPILIRVDAQSMPASVKHEKIKQQS